MYTTVIVIVNNNSIQFNLMPGHNILWKEMSFRVFFEYDQKYETTALAYTFVAKWKIFILCDTRPAIALSVFVNNCLKSAHILRNLKNQFF